jgi:hypothetical protein
MDSGTIVILAAFAAVVALFVFVAARVYLKFRGVRVVTCPETAARAVVAVDAGHAALSAAWDKMDLRLEDCSRWAERGRCAEPCLKQIAAAPADCLLRSVLVRWYAGKQCVGCGKAVEIRHFHQLPGLRRRDGHVVDFSSLEPAVLVATLDEHDPICFDCLVAEQFREAYPDLVIDRYKAS